MRTPLFVLLILASPISYAAGKGDLVLQAGPSHIRPQESSEPLHTELRSSLLSLVPGIEESFTSPGTSARVTNSETLVTTAKYFVTDHIGLQVEGGIPVKFDIHGSGIVQATGIGGALASVDLGAPGHDPIASARQWSPVLMAVYHFRRPDAVLRPYLGLGVTYTWFTDVELNDDFERELNRQFGAPLAVAALKPGDTRVQVDASSDTAPVFAVGANYAFNERWGLSLSAAHLALSTSATLKIKAEDGTTLATSTTDLDLNPVALTLLLNYTF